MMRRILSCALALLMLSAGPAGGAMAENGYLAYDFEPTLITGFDMSASEWLSSGEYRALATILIAFDMMGVLGSDGDRAPDVMRASYVGQDGDDLIIYLHAQAQDILVRYTPKDGSGNYSVFEPLDDETVTASMSRICPNGSYANDIMSMFTVAQYLRELTSQAQGESGSPSQGG